MPGGTRPWCSAAGIAGLLSARVLSSFFERVEVIERDPPSATGPRRGVPQGNHLHIMLPGGRKALEELVPGYIDALISAGGIRASSTSSTKAYFEDRWVPRFDSDLWSVLCGRPLFEAVLRDEVLRSPGIELRTGWRAVGLRTDAHGSVTGAVVETTDEGVEEALDADLIVDATGRSSRAANWLAELGFDSPDETVINGFWGYSTRYYRLPPGWDPGWLTLALVPTGRDGRTRGAVIQLQDGERWACGLIGCAHDYPPTDDDAFEAFVASLPVPDFAEVLAAGEPLTPAVGWRRTENRRRHFERLSGWPDGFVVIGDALTSVNPVYGQGMSVAALSAAELHRQLADSAERGNLMGLAARFQQALGAIVSLPWNLASGADYLVPGAEVQPLPVEQRDFLERWRRAGELSAQYPEIRPLLIETRYLIHDPEWLYKGDIADRINAEWGRLDDLTSSSP